MKTWTERASTLIFCIHITCLPHAVTYNPFGTDTDLKIASDLLGPFFGLNRVDDGTQPIFKDVINFQGNQKNQKPIGKTSPKSSLL